MQSTGFLLLTCVCIRRHQGFVRLAAETGAQIVPVISFGENDLFTAEPVKADTPFGKFQRYAARAQHRPTPHTASCASTGARVRHTGQARVLATVSQFRAAELVRMAASDDCRDRQQRHDRCGATLSAPLSGTADASHHCWQVGPEERRHHGAQLLVGGAAPGSRQHGLWGTHQGESSPSAMRATLQG